MLIDENFNSIAEFPDGWPVEGHSKAAGSATWKIGGFPGMPGSVKTALCDSSYTDYKARAEKLILPAVDLPDGGERTFVFECPADAVNWTVENGILSGTAQGTLNPQGTAACAQAAAILTRMLSR